MKRRISIRQCVVGGWGEKEIILEMYSLPTNCSLECDKLQNT